MDTVLKAENSLRPIENVTTQEIKSPEPNIEQVSSIMVDFVTGSILIFPIVLIVVVKHLLNTLDKIFYVESVRVNAHYT